MSESKHTPSPATEEPQAEAARPFAQVIAEVRNPCRAKSEHEWVAARMIEELLEAACLAQMALLPAVCPDLDAAIAKAGGR